MKRCREESWQCSYCGDDGCVQGKCEEVEPCGFVCLHNVQHKGTWQLLCTNCVLMSHPGLFCPICLQTFEPSSTPPPVGHRLMCLKCPSMAHLSCSSSSSSSSSSSASSSSFLCPPCSCSSQFRFFSNGNGFFNRDNAKALVTAATIASFSMNKAAIAARADAERLLKEALAAKQRAKEALELLAHLVAIDNQNKNKGKDASTMTTTSLEQD